MLDVTAVIGREIVQGVETRARITTQGGGAAANVASWLAANGTESFLVARVGDDAAGHTLLEELNTLGVHHSNNVIAGVSTGVVMVLVDPLGERTMFPDSGANSGLSPADLPSLDGFDALYLSGYPLVNPLSLIFDPSTVGVLLEVGVAKVREWLGMMDAIILNEEEAQFITGFGNPVEAAADLLNFASAVVIKRGGNGALGQYRGGPLIQVSASPTTVVNTTGAGDAFAAGFIQIWAANGELHDALESGANLAGQCVALIGSRPLVAPQ